MNINHNSWAISDAGGQDHQFQTNSPAMQLKSIFVALTMTLVMTLTMTLAVGFVTKDNQDNQDNQDPSVLGVAYKEGVDSFYAAIGALNAASGNLSFSTASSPYTTDPQLQPCINAKFSSGKKTMYAIQTFDQVSHQYAFDVIDNTGTVAHRNFSQKGKVLSYLVVAWSYSATHQHFVSIGWPANSAANDNSIKTMFDGRVVVTNGDDAEVSFINPSTGAVQLLTTVPGYAFLECGALATNNPLSKNWFHYIWVDYSNNIFTGSVQLPGALVDANTAIGEKFQFLAVGVPAIYGLIINLASTSSLGSSFVVSTEHGLILLVQPELGIISPFGALDKNKGKVSLAASTLTSDGQLLTFLKGESNQLAVRSGDANHTTKYVPIDASDYVVSLANF